MQKSNNKAGLKIVEKETESVEKGSDILAETTYNAQEHKDKTRSGIALYFVKSYIKLIAFIFLAVFSYNIVLVLLRKDNFVLEIKDIFPLVIGTVGTLLGFVLGYYFKSEEKN